MRILIITSFILLGIQFSVNGQNLSPHAIGIRFNGGNIGGGAEVSYQQALSDRTRLEINVGVRSQRAVNLRSSSLIITPAYHWNFNLYEALDWFVGPAGQIGLINETIGTERSTGLIAGIGGQAGIEYNFNHLRVPIQAALDTRPMFGVMGSGMSGWFGISLSVRYTFGN